MPDDGPLPDKVVTIESRRIARGVGKRCRCYTHRFLVDEETREVTCRDCGSRVDPFDAMLRLARHYETLQAEVQALLEQRREIASYEPRLVALRKLEALLHERKMMPSCPHCFRGITLEEFGGMGMTNREIEMERRSAEKEERRRERDKEVSSGEVLRGPR